MPSTILSDNGVSSGSAGLKTTAASDGALALQTTTAGGTATTAVTIDTSQNVGIKTTPNAWGSSAISAQLSASALTCLSSTNTYLSHNAYVNSSSQNIYINSDYASLYRQNSGIHYWYTAASGSAGATISYTQSLSVGKAITLALEGATSQSGTGITFPATQSASSNANTLDDYEEGTWSPTLTPGTSGSFTSYFRQFGYYTKVGNAVTVSTYLTVANGGASSPVGTYVRMSLPFSIAATSGCASITTLTDGTLRSGYLDSSTNCIIININAASIYWGGSNDFMVSVTYLTA